MDLAAYVNIENLEDLLKENNIEIPRLRGLRLMSEEEILTRKDIKEGKKEAYEYECERSLESCIGIVDNECPFVIHSCAFSLGSETDFFKKLFLKYKFRKYEGSDEPIKEVCGIKGELLTPLQADNLKYRIIKKSNAATKQANMFNKYVGRKDVIQIHARHGSEGWAPEFIKEAKTKYGYLDSCDDGGDPSYCDIYAKIKGV